jgi:hypothetical protein
MFYGDFRWMRAVKKQSQTKPNFPEAKVIRHKAKGIRNSLLLCSYALCSCVKLKKQSQFVERRNDVISVIAMVYGDLGG